MGTNTGLFFRPAWVLQIARDVDAFLRAGSGTAPESPLLQAFFATLPPPDSDVERRFFDDLRDAVVRVPVAASVVTRAERARELLIAEYRKPWTLVELARAVGCNRTTLQEEFQRLTHVSVHRFLIQQRVTVAEHLLERSDLKVSRVSQEVGYRSASAFARHFKKITGVTLATYRGSHHHAPPVVVLD